MESNNNNNLLLYYKLSCKCPFCLKQNVKHSSKNHFDNVDLLVSHVQQKHPGCTLIGKRPKSGFFSSSTTTNKSTTTTTTTSNIPSNHTTRLGKRKSPRQHPNHEPRHEYQHTNNPDTTTTSTRLVNKRKQPTTPDDEPPHQEKHSNPKCKIIPSNKSSPMKLLQHWETLSLDILQENTYYDRSIAQYGHNIHLMIQKIEDRLNILASHLKIRREGSLMSSKDDQDDEDYVNEMKLFYKTCLCRAGMADQEKLEKIKFKDHWEESVRKYQYENRGQKRTSADIEYKRFLHRPFQFVEQTLKRSKRTKQRDCSIGGEMCNLCNASYAKYIITSDELDKVDGDIQQVIPIPIENSKQSEILKPTFRKLQGDNDIPDDDHNGYERGVQRIPGKKAKVRTLRQKNIGAKREYWELNSLKNSLHYINEYNKGYLESFRSSLI